MDQEDRNYWLQQADGQQDGGAFAAAPAEHKAQTALCSVLRRFSDAFALSKSWHSSEGWEERFVTPACMAFVEAIKHAAPFWEAFKNKPKVVAVLELAI